MPAMIPLNTILGHLRPETFRTFSEDLQEVALATGDVLHEVGDHVHYVYFPVGAVLSVITIFRDGGAVESATIGREGAAGLLGALGGGVVNSRVFVQIAGSAWRISVARFQDHAYASRSTLQRFLEAVQNELAQAQQSAACNAVHDVAGRLPRWLLMTQDRVDGRVLPLTQTYLATMLGVQRTTVSTAAHALKDDGVIAYTRGRITVLKREELLRRACECYQSSFEAIAARPT